MQIFFSFFHHSFFTFNLNTGQLRDNYETITRQIRDWNVSYHTLYIYYVYIFRDFRKYLLKCCKLQTKNRPRL